MAKLIRRRCCFAQIAPECFCRDSSTRSGLSGQTSFNWLARAVRATRPYARDRLGDVGRNVRRDRELGVPLKYREHLLGGETCGRRVPEREVRDPVGVDVLRALFQFGERGEGVAGFGVPGIIDLDQDGTIRLDDEGIGRIEHGGNRTIGGGQPPGVILGLRRHDHRQSGVRSPIGAERPMLLAMVVYEQAEVRDGTPRSSGRSLACRSVDFRESQIATSPAPPPTHHSTGFPGVRESECQLHPSWWQSGNGETVVARFGGLELGVEVPMKTKPTC